MDIVPSTYYEWKKRFPEIAEALSRGKEIADIEIENALFNLSKGYTVQVAKTFKLRHIDYDENGRKVREYEILKTGFDEVHVPANVNAPKFWLSNRRPDKWRERMEPPAESKNNELLQSLLDLERQDAQ